MKPIAEIFYYEFVLALQSNANDCMIKEKDITIHDLANELNISIATVSRALNENPIVRKKTRKKFFELAEKRATGRHWWNTIFHLTKQMFL